MSTFNISHVSDTALMTAGCRALETERPDGWVRDPFAERLAGERGMAIARGLPGVEVMSFGVGMRSRILDTLLVEDIPARGVSTVLCAGAGLDTRPWRLNLPSDLRWVEVDLGPILEYKHEVLGSETPRCRIETLPADLNDAAQRRKVFDAAGPGPTLLFTEGLLMYLPAATVESIAAEARSTAAIQYWLLDIATAAMSRAVRMSSYEEIEAVRAADNLNGEGILEVLARSGWIAADSRTYGRTGMKMIPPGRVEAIARAMASAKPGTIPAPPPPTDPSGVHLFATAATQSEPETRSS